MTTDTHAADIDARVQRIADLADAYVISPADMIAAEIEAIERDLVDNFGFTHRAEIYSFVNRLAAVGDTLAPHVAAMQGGA